MELPIRNRSVAGRARGEALAAYTGQRGFLVLALPHGGRPAPRIVPGASHLFEAAVVLQHVARRTRFRFLCRLSGHEQ